MVSFEDVSESVHNEVSCLNDMILEAISHGGDSGGAYFTNKEGLGNAIDNYLGASGLTYLADIYWKDEEYPLVVVNEKELNCEGCVKNYLESRGGYE